MRRIARMLGQRQLQMPLRLHSHCWWQRRQRASAGNCNRFLSSAASNLSSRTQNNFELLSWIAGSCGADVSRSLLFSSQSLPFNSQSLPFSSQSL
jgi:hypothetical protein